MVCIAAFIVLLAIWLFTPILRLLGKKKLANTISKLFKKSVHCFSRRVTLRACDSNFKDEIKESILSKLIIRHKKLVKPVSAGIEVSAILIVFITIWSSLTIVKSGLALYVYGTCNVKTPASCALSTSQACSIDNFEKSNPVKDWFTDWGEIFGALPSRVKTWNASEYIPTGASFYEVDKNTSAPKKDALDIFDPGCIVCRNSFNAQLKSGFFSKYKTYIIPYVITGEDGDKFKNSRLVANYIEAVRGRTPKDKSISAEWVIVENLFTGKDKEGRSYQELFNGTSSTTYSEKEATEKIESWLLKAGFTKEEILEIREKTTSDEVKAKLKENSKLVEDKIKTKRIPTMIYDGKRHEGLFEDK